MKPFLENIANPQGASWSMLDRRLDGGIPFEWHHHPEYELTLTLNSTGQRFVGDHIGTYEDGDLVLLGPNLPHTWASISTSDEEMIPNADRLAANAARPDQKPPHTALVMWFSPQWADGLTDNFVELASISKMLHKSGRGLKFSNSFARKARPQITTLFNLAPPDRLLALVALLQMLAGDDRAQTLSEQTNFVARRTNGDHDRIDRVLAYIHANYTQPTSLTQVSAIAALSISGFHRLFKREMQVPFSTYVSRLRIGEACALLSGTHQPISHISDSVGFHALANFNRQFKSLKGMTPREYRSSTHR